MLPIYVSNACYAFIAGQLPRPTCSCPSSTHIPSHEQGAATSIRYPEIYVCAQLVNYVRTKQWCGQCTVLWYFGHYCELTILESFLICAVLEQLSCYLVLGVLHRFFLWTLVGWILMVMLRRCFYVVWTSDVFTFVGLNMIFLYVMKILYEYLIS